MNEIILEAGLRAIEQDLAELDNWFNTAVQSRDKWAVSIPNIVYTVLQEKSEEYHTILQLNGRE